MIWEVVQSHDATLTEIRENWYYSDLIKWQYLKHIEYINNRISNPDNGDS